MGCALRYRRASVLGCTPEITERTGGGFVFSNWGEWQEPITCETIEACAMATLSDFEKLLPPLSPGERAQILKWVVRDLGDAFPGIDSRPEVCNGQPCIVRTRIPVWLLEQARRLGTSEQTLLAAYPSLRAEDLVNAWAYARSHATEIDEQIRDNETA